MKWAPACTENLRIMPNQMTLDAVMANCGRTPYGIVRHSTLWLKSVPVEDRFNGPTEESRDIEGEHQAGAVPSGLNGIHRLRDTARCAARSAWDHLRSQRKTRRRFFIA